MSSWEHTINKTEAKNLMANKKKEVKKDDPRVKWDGEPVEMSVKDYKKSGWNTSTKKKKKLKEGNMTIKTAIHSIFENDLEGLRTYIHDALNEKTINAIDEAKEIIAKDILSEGLADKAIKSFSGSSDKKSSRERARAIIAKKLGKNKAKKNV